MSYLFDSPLTCDDVEHQSPPPSSTSLKSTPTTTSNAWLWQDCSFSSIPPLLLPLLSTVVCSLPLELTLTTLPLCHHHPPPTSSLPPVSFPASFPIPALQRHFLNLRWLLQANSSVFLFLWLCNLFHYVIRCVASFFLLLLTESDVYSYQLPWNSEINFSLLLLLFFMKSSCATLFF